jgi:hypothetical protein
LNKEKGTAPTVTSTGSEGGEEASLKEQAQAWYEACNGGIIELVGLDCARSGTSIAIGRTVRFGPASGKPLYQLREPVWPVWVPESGSDSNLAEFEKTWANASRQARATAKWLAAILGIALAALIGSAPLSGIRGEYIPLRAYVIGAAGLACIAFTLFLVVCVLVPEVTGFEDLISGERPFKDLKERFERNAGILLPLRVRTFAELGGRTRVEALTLEELEKRINEYRDSGAGDEEFKAYCDAQQGRSKWLSYLMRTANQWAVIASYQAVKEQADRARNVGIISGTVGTALIVATFLMPTLQSPAANLTTYKLAHGSIAAAAAQSIIGDRCATFKGVVVHADSNGALTVLVQPTDACNSASITVPGTDLMQIP